jgi:hypothetical protein
VTVGGGTTPYSYQWSGGAVIEDISDLTAGVYSVEVTDAANEVIFGSTTLTQPRLLFQLTSLLGDSYPRWSPDGKKVVFASFGQTANSELWSVSVD